MTKQAAALLEASPDPNLVVDGIFENLLPSSWGGSRADIIAERAEAMKTFLENENERISVAAVRFLEKAKEAEDREREWEARHNEGEDPSFE